MRRELSKAHITVLSFFRMRQIKEKTNDEKEKTVYKSFFQGLSFPCVIPFGVGFFLVNRRFFSQSMVSN